MSRIQRFDRGDLVPAHKTDEGFLFIDGRATRAGVFLYRDNDGNIRRELRPPDEVGAPESLATLARKPITLLHPEEFVDAQNAQEFSAGVTDPEVEWETQHADGFVRVRGTVQRADAVKAIEDGVQELSAGYTAELELESGVWTDSAGVEHRYDAIQRNIRYNHLAIVLRGRAGRDVRLRLDGAAIQVSREDMKKSQMDMLAEAMKKKMADGKMSKEELVADMAKAAGCEPKTMADMLAGKMDMPQKHFEACAKRLNMKMKHEDSAKGAKPTQMEFSMPTIKIDGHEYSVEETPAVQRAIVAVETARNDALAELEVLRSDNDTKDAELEELRQAKAELDVLKASEAKRGDADQGDTDQERIDFANERFELIETARALKLDGFGNIAEVGATNAEIKQAIVLSRFDADEVPTEAHVDAAFSLMKKEIAKARENAPSPNDVLARNLLRADTTQQPDVLQNAHKAYMDRVMGHNTKSTH